MSAISWSNTIRDYLATYKGWLSGGLATYAQTFVNRMTTVFDTVAQDASLIQMMERMDRIILQAAKEAYDGGLVDDDLIDAALLIKHPEWAGLTAMLGDIIETDLNLRIGGSATVPTWTQDGMTAAQLATAGIKVRDCMLATVSDYLEKVTHSMRYFVAAKAAESGVSSAISAAPEYGNPYMSCGWPGV